MLKMQIWEKDADEDGYFEFKIDDEQAKKIQNQLSYNECQRLTVVEDGNYYWFNLSSIQLVKIEGVK